MFKMRNKSGKSSIINNNSSVFIATFSHYENGLRLPANGQIEPMLSFVLPRVKNVLLLDQPHPISDIINPIIEKYKNGKLVEKYCLQEILYFPIYFYCKIEKTGLTRISYKLRDFFSVFFIALTQKEKFDLFIGLESINTLAGIILRKLGKVETVVYYVSDYSPNRFSKFGKTRLNTIYLWLDRFCVRHADFTWDVSSVMQKARIKAGLSPKSSYKVIHVPNGLFPLQIRSLPIEKRHKHDLVYMGILESDMGPDLAIKAFREVMKHYPRATLHIIGGARKDIETMKILAKKLKINKSVIFYGFVQDNEKMAEIVRSCYIGLAPYRAISYSQRWYGDAGKIRQYLASGLPVVTTHVPPLGRLTAEKGAAIMTNDTVEDFSHGILKLLSNDSLYKELAIKAEILSKKNTWENSYAQAFKKMDKLRSRDN